MCNVKKWLRCLSYFSMSSECLTNRQNCKKFAALQKCENHIFKNCIPFLRELISIQFTGVFIFSPDTLSNISPQTTSIPALGVGKSIAKMQGGTRTRQNERGFQKQQNMDKLAVIDLFGPSSHISGRVLSGIRNPSPRPSNISFWQHPVLSPIVTTHGPRFHL